MKDFPYVIYILSDELERIEEDLKNDVFVGDEEELKRMKGRKRQLKEALNILLNK